MIKFKDILVESLPETKMYSDFIKKNKIKLTHYGFIFNNEEIRVYKSDDNRWWYAGEDGDNAYTKKAAIYWYIKNHTNNER